MIAKIFYLKNSPGQAAAEEYARRLGRLSVECELIDGDTPAGQAQTELYDLPDRPAMILVRDDGSPIQSWPHEFPPPSDVSYLAHQ